jgi:predicted RNA-binding protein with PIN domain
LDGYNLIHADPELKRTVRSGLEGARERLVQRLTRYLGSKSVRMTVVFDGHGGITDIEVKIPGRLQLMYSAAGQSADDLILKILESSANPREYVVVTSDMADIGRSARALGAKVIPSPEFLSRIGRSRREITSEQPNEVAGDVDYWLERFGGEEDTGSEN